MLLHVPSQPKLFLESLGGKFDYIIEHMFVNDSATCWAVVFAVDCRQMLCARELTARCTDWRIVFVTNSVAVFNLAHAHIFVIVDWLIALGACGDDGVCVVSIVSVVEHASHLSSKLDRSMIG